MKGKVKKKTQKLMVISTKPGNDPERKHVEKEKITKHVQIYN